MSAVPASRALTSIIVTQAHPAKSLSFVPPPHCHEQCLCVWSVELHNIEHVFGPELAEHFGVSDNQHLFGVLESLFLFSFSRYGGAAGGASGQRILWAKGPNPTLILVQANM